MTYEPDYSLRGQGKPADRGLILHSMTYTNSKNTIYAMSKYLSAPRLQRTGKVTRNFGVPRNVTLLYGRVTSKH